jgi:hypothetical protein
VVNEQLPQHPMANFNVEDHGLKNRWLLLICPLLIVGYQQEDEDRDRITTSEKVGKT